MQAYCFRFYFLLVTVIILAGMVLELVNQASSSSCVNAGSLLARHSVPFFG